MMLRVSGSSLSGSSSSPKQLHELVGEGFLQIGARFQMVALFTLAQTLHEIERGIDADVALDERFFKLIVEIVVDLLAAEHAEHFFHKTTAGF